MSDGELPKTQRMIRRVARADPSLFAEAIASRVGCSVDEVHRELGSSSQVLTQMARSLSEDDRCDVAADPDCPVSLLRRLAADPSPLVRLEVAANMSCPAAVLGRLAGDQNPVVRHAVARHKSCPTRALSILASDKEVFVRLEVAANEGCPPALLDRLHGDPLVRRVVERNPNWSR